MAISTSGTGLIFVLLLFACYAMKTNAETRVCINRGSPCFLYHIPPSPCPQSCHCVLCYITPTMVVRLPVNQTKHQYSYTLKTNNYGDRKPNCNGRGSACLDPRFVGADGIVFYFHGKRDEHFSLVSDVNLQVNARFIGLRPEGRSRDYTWIQALGILFDSHNFSVEATPTATWDDETDHLKLSYNGEELVIPQEHFSNWQCPESQIKVERTSSKNSVMVAIPELAEISVNVVPVTKEDSRIHNYQIPADSCFAHLEVQFKFFGLSPEVDGVLGRTYQLDFKNPAKLGVAMPVVGGEDRYRTSSLLSADCGVCVFSPAEASEKKNTATEYGLLDCTGVANSGNGIVCRR